MSTASGPVPQPADASPPRTCPRCGHPLAAGQDWCLHCGAAATTRVAAPPSWRGPLVAMLGVLVLALAALALAFFALADDEPASDPPAVETPAPDEPLPGATPTPTPAATATPTPDDGADAAPGWPEGESAWTVVLNSTTSRSAARRRAERFQEEGIDAGVLRSNDFSSLRPGFWVVFSGQYDSARAAARAQRQMAGAPASAYVREITPR